MTLDLRHRDIDVVGSGEIARGPHERVVVEYVDDARHLHEHVVVGDLRLIAALATLVAAPTTVAEPTAPAPAVGVVIAIAVARVTFPTLITVDPLTAIAPLVIAVDPLIAVAALLTVTALLTVDPTVAVAPVGPVVAVPTVVAVATVRPLAPLAAIGTLATFIAVGAFTLTVRVAAMSVRVGAMSTFLAAAAVAGGTVVARFRRASGPSRASGNPLLRGRLRVAHLGTHLGPTRLIAGSDLRPGRSLGARTRHPALGLVILDRCDQVTLAHLRRARDTERRSHRLQLVEQHSVKAASGPTPTGRARGRVWSARNFRRDVGGVAQWIPSLDGPGRPRRLR